MVNKIHDFEPHSIQDHLFTRKSVRLDGYETDADQRTALMEMFGRAEFNIVQKERLGGPHYTIDLTSDQRNIVYCSFDDDELISGWYALKSFTYLPVQAKLNFHPYRITMVFIGTYAMYQQFYGVTDQETVSNDWSI